MARKQAASVDDAPQGPVTLTPTENFSLAINGTLVTFTQGQSFVADATLQAAIAAANAPVAQ